MRFLEILAASFSFFSRIPVPAILLPEGEPPYGMMLALSPIVGGVLGALWGGLGVLLSLKFAALGAAWSSALIYILLGWGLHLDGLSDIADGWGSGRSGSALKEVIKDSSCGPYGAMALIVALGLWTSLLFAFPSWRWITIGIIVGASGRWAMCCASFFGHYPWKNGMGLPFVEGFSVRELAYSFVCFAIFFLIGPWLWILSFLSTSIVSALLTIWAHEKIGGVSGDVLGTIEVLAELFALATIALFTS